MEKEKYVVFSGEVPGPEVRAVPPEAEVRIITMDKSAIEGCIWTLAGWYTAPLEVPGLRRHASREVVMFLGSDHDHPEELDGHIIFYVDGEPIDLKKSCLLFIPHAVPHNPFEIVEMNHPCLHFSGGNNSSCQKQ